MARSGIGFCGLVLLLAASCGTSDDSGKSYADNQGRVCTIDTRSRNQMAVCDVEATPTNGCGMGSPCFMVHVTLDIAQLQNCESCCVGNTPSFPSGFDCALITCRTASDCPHAQPVCRDSFCFAATSSSGGAAGAAGSMAMGGVPGASGGSGGTAGVAGMSPGVAGGGASMGGFGFGGASPSAGRPGAGGSLSAAGAPGFSSSGSSAAGTSGAPSAGRSGFPFGP